MDRIESLINRSNQRGGRMLSIIDLIADDTLSLAQAAWIAVRILDGSSFLIGARPGGAGKTTVMGALLGLLPAATAAHLATSDGGWRDNRPGDCLIAYEISPGFYDAYIWGEDLRSFCRFGKNGRRIVSNLHADSPEEVVDQLVSQNGVDPAHAFAFDLFLPIRVSGGFGRTKRRIESIFHAAGNVWTESKVDHDSLDDRGRKIETFFGDCSRGGVKTIEAVRKRWITLMNEL